ncbi:30S ribosomal protein S4 [Chitinivibrio alkaliphilus]|uniref:Small ribosomal subunit protein uS4 n=1 Tax=Chitinivibrio alkaliphilus ACht1 TaxID=1313304 RepID=U7D8N8_9BACT|nr:30S ribosomal protein S4 [Chitinivibrio alkaliphilus]ERP31457.1 ribosomal protein S4 [Chitinivibrio alkaliphilus ACht1]
MSRNLKPKAKIVRRFRSNIFENEKYSRILDKKPAPPGPKKKRRPNVSEYGKQLGEKQKIRYSYGLSERQFRNTFKKAKQLKGVTDGNMITLLESRLDNVVYRLGMASTRSQARQLVNHNHIRVNGKKMDIPSYTVCENDVITVRDRNKSKKLVQDYIAENAGKTIPEWLEFSKVDGTGKILRKPQREDVVLPGDIQLVVEFYSK